MTNPTVNPTTPDPTDPGAKPPKRRRTTALIVAGVVVVAAVTAAVIGYNGNWGKPAPAQPAASSPGSAGEPGGDVVSPGTGTGTSGGDASAPSWKHITFEDFHGAQLPVSPLYGPKVHTDSRASGFAHNLGGAVEAAVHIGSRVSAQAGPDTYGPAIEQQMTGDTSTFRTQLDSDYQDARQNSGVPDGTPLRIYAQIIGYAADGADASGQTVTLHLLSRGANPNGGTVTIDFPMTLEWVGDDWKVRAPDGGQWPFNPVTSTAGYTLFPGVNAS
ncbi:hypothetical protein ACWDBD_46980 [Streptomyces sp. NPDC001118]